MRAVRIEQCAGAGVDGVFDSAGRPALCHDFQVARLQGLVVSFGISSGAVDLSPAELGEAGSLYLTRPRLRDYLPDAATVQARTDELYRGWLTTACRCRSAGTTPCPRSGRPAPASRNA